MKPDVKKIKTNPVKMVRTVFIADGFNEKYKN
jgi:hypothetical protein